LDFRRAVDGLATGDGRRAAGDRRQACHPERSAAEPRILIVPTERRALYREPEDPSPDGSG